MAVSNRYQMIEVEGQSMISRAGGLGKQSIDLPQVELAQPSRAGGRPVCPRQAWPSLGTHGEQAERDEHPSLVSHRPKHIPSNTST